MSTSIISFLLHPVLTLCVVFSLSSCFDDVIGILLSFLDAGFLLPGDTEKATGAELQGLISDIDDKNLVGHAICAVAEELAKVGGNVPQTQEGLRALNLDDKCVVASYARRVRRSYL